MTMHFAGVLAVVSDVVMGASYRMTRVAPLTTF